VLAKAACAQASRQGRRVADASAADALRLNGIYEWLVGRRVTAQRLWRQGIATAERRNAKLALARLHHELGTRAGDAAHLESARRLFQRMWHNN
jgi:hypothetical protein